MNTRVLRLELDFGAKRSEIIWSASGPKFDLSGFFHEHLFFSGLQGHVMRGIFLRMGSQQTDCTQTRPLEMFSERQVGVNQRNSNSNSPGESFCWCHLDVILMWVPLVIIHFSGIFYETIQRFFGVPAWHWKAPFFCAESMMTPQDPNHGAGIFIYQHLPLSKITQFW